MSAPHEPFLGPEARLDSFWLPPGTIDNGLPASRWAVIAVLEHDQAVRLLARFAAAGVPARMATDQHPDRSHSSTAGPTGGPDTRIWVDPERYAEAENILLGER